MGYQQTIAQLRRRLKDDKQEIVQRGEAQRRDVLSAPRRPQAVKTVKDISFEECSATDRRSVIARLLSKEQVLLFLYGKLFPYKETVDASEGAMLPAVAANNTSLARNNAV